MHKVTGLESDERVTGIYCAAGSSTCVLSAGGLSGTKGHISSFTATAVNGTPLVASDQALADLSGLVGDVEFLGFTKVGSRLIARLDKALGDVQLYTGFAADATHFAIGGKSGNLFSTF